MAHPAIFDLDVYVEARANRLRNLFCALGDRSFNEMRILEVGCGLGDLGEAFVARGSTVVSIDARPEFVEGVRAKYPNRQCEVMDHENWQPSHLGHFDAILCFGLLYHLSQPTAFMRSCAAISNELWLETMVCDSTEAKYLVVPESGDDQAHSGFGCRPSPVWLEMVLGHFGYHVQDISSAVANWGGSAPSVFDWTPVNDDSFERDGAFLRKMFLARK